MAVLIMILLWEGDPVPDGIWGSAIHLATCRVGTCHWVIAMAVGVIILIAGCIILTVCIIHMLMIPG